MRTNPLHKCGIRVADLALIVSCLVGCCVCPIGAAELEQAQVTRAVNDVRILQEDKAPRPAKPGNLISGTTALRTGDRSRAELEFSDQSLVRLGSNSVFGFKSGDREMELRQGSLLLQMPKDRGKTKIRAASITAAITGTTILFESSRGVFDAGGREVKPGVVKLIVMEGKLEWSFNADPRKKLKMVAGDMVVFPANARTFPKKVKVDLGRIKKTSLLMDGGMGQLPEVGKVDREIAAQNRLSRDANHPARGFPIKSPKPDNLERGVRAVQPDPVVIPPRPER